MNLMQSILIIYIKKKEYNLYPELESFPFFSPIPQFLGNQTDNQTTIYNLLF